MMTRITTNGASTAPVSPATATDAVTPVQGATARANAHNAAGQPLQSAVLGPALAALREMPELDQPRVAELRSAMANGAVPFDPAKLAVLIERFHGGRL